MDLTPEAVSLGVRLAEALARNTATVINDRVRALVQNRKNEQTVAGLEEIINDLIADKAELTRIAQSYEAQLVAQRLEDKDVQYIVDTVMPLLRQILGNTGQADTLEQIEAMSPLLSVETVNVLQILGFDFRSAVGEPLTALLRQSILARVPSTGDAQLEGAKREQAYVQLALDADAFSRFRELFPAAT